MASDELVWKILDSKFCSYKMPRVIDGDKICGHPMNVNGLCRQTYCPLANSKYATVIERKGKIFLCIKTPERSHLPSQWWEKTELDKNHVKALEQVDQAMQWWPKNQIHRVKKRYLRYLQVLRRMRRLRLMNLPKLVTVKKKLERRLQSREQKALRIAHLETTIEQQLLQRLRSGVYPQSLYQTSKSSDKLKETDEEREEETETIEEAITLEQDDEDEVEFVEDESEEEEEDEDEIDYDELENEKDIEDILDEYEKKFDRKRKSRGDNSTSALGEDGNDDDDDVDRLVRRIAKRKRTSKNIEIEYEDSDDKQRQY